MEDQNIAKGQTFCSGETAVEGHKSTYRALSVLGYGGFSTVHQAQSAEGETVAVKMFCPEMVEAGILKCGKDRPTSDLSIESRIEDARDAFNNEMRALQSLDHPNIIKVKDGVPRDDDPFYIMEHLPFNYRQLEPSDIKLRKLLSAMSSFLTYLDERNLDYMDMKLENIGMDSRGNVKFLDMGALRHRDDLTGKVYTTEDYTPPELMTLGVVSSNHDIYTAGKTLEAFLAGDICDTSEEAIEMLEVATFGRAPQSLKDILIETTHSNPNRRADIKRFRELVDKYLTETEGKKIFGNDATDLYLAAHAEEKADGPAYRKTVPSIHTAPTRDFTIGDGTPTSEYMRRLD